MFNIDSHPLVHIQCEQNSPEWLAARCGIVTASEFDAVQAKGIKGAPSKTRATYLRTKVGEQMTGALADGWAGNKHTERGHLMEPDARRAYAFMTDTSPVLVGFMRRGPVGCSPDSLIGDTGLVEIKTKLPHIQLDLLDNNEVPSEHTAQIQGQLWVTGRAFCDFVSYWPGLPLFVKRVHRDETYISDLAAAVSHFLTDMAAYKARIESLYQLKEAA